MTVRGLPAVLLVGALALAGCSATTSGSPTAPATNPGSTASAAPAPGGAGTCRVEAGRGTVSMRGGSGRVATTNGVTTFTCGGGPAITLAEIGADGVGLQVDGAAVTPIRPGETTAVGPYTITLDAVAGGRATLRVVPG